MCATCHGVNTERLRKVPAACALAACALAACSSGGNGDAGAAADVAVDVALEAVATPGDAAVDAAPDATLDAPQDAPALPVVPVGGACDPNERANVCAAASTCAGTGTAARCVADGAMGGRCRTATSRCDAGLACDDDRLAPTCRTAVAEGERCDPAGVTNICVSPARCTTAMAVSTCRTAPYIESRLMPPTFVNACASGGTRIALAGTSRDDTHATAPLTIPFTFRFFGVDYTRVWPSTNGYAVFGATAPQDRPGGRDRFPADEGPLVAAFWADLVLRAAPGSDLCVRTVGAAPDRQFVIEWLDAYHTTYDSTHLTFEVVLTETTNTVDVIYNRLDPAGDTTAEYVRGALATIGLQSDRGAQFVAHAGTVATTAGLRFTPR